MALNQSNLNKLRDIVGAASFGRFEARMVHAAKRLPKRDFFCVVVPVVVWVTYSILEVMLQLETAKRKHRIRTLLAGRAHRTPEQRRALKEVRREMKRKRRKRVKRERRQDRMRGPQEKPAPTDIPRPTDY